jgi:hypothetical protein
MTTRNVFGLLLLLVVALPGRAFAVQILSPIEGTIVRSGQPVVVRVGPSPGEVISSIRIATSEGNTEVLTAAGGTGAYEGQVRLPMGAVGPELILVAASLVDGRLVSAHVQVEADPGPLQRLVIQQPPSLGFTGQVVQLEVTGVFADGVSRDLTAPETGTLYESSNAAVLGVDPSGLLQARSNGTASVRVRCRGLTATATVPVTVPSGSDNRIPVAEPGPDRIVGPLTVVSLSATASSDADGDPLTYAWEQLTGPWISLRSAGQANASFLSPAVTAETVMEFSLTVKDSRGAASFPKTVRITVTP